MRQSQKTFLVWTLIVLFVFSLYTLVQDTSTRETPLDVQEFKAALLDPAKTAAMESIRVDPGTRDNARYIVTYKSGGTRHVVDAEYNVGMTDRLTNSGVSYKVKPPDDGSFWPGLISVWLPLLLLVGMMVFFMRQMQNNGGKAMTFGKSKARLLTESQNRITFKDVAGVEEAKEEVEEIISFLKAPKKFTRLGGRIPKGVLMMGPPGTGKTLLARAIAGEAGVPFFSISGSDFVEMFVGVGASRVRDLFEQGKKHAPCIIFIDEIDAVGRHRGAGLGGGHDEREQTLNQLLVEMDGFESSDGVIMIAATNRPDVLDPALLRPGRFDRRIVVPRPDLRGRLEILMVHTRNKPVGPDVDLEVIARGTPGFSGADLEALVNEAALLAARRDKDKIGPLDFDEAKDKVLMGSERRSMIISDKEKRTTAIHEAGHALVARFVGIEADPVHKITIIPRGRALGLTQQLPQEDRLSMTADFAKNQIAILMGGRVAEEIVFAQKTTGAGNDIERATELARSMVTEWGMSEQFGPLNFAGKQQEVFLGRDFGSSERHSEDTAQRIDAEIRRLVTEQYARAMTILTDKRPQLEALAAALLDHETLDHEDMEVILRGETISRPLPAKRPTGLRGADDKKGPVPPTMVPPVAPEPV